MPMNRIRVEKQNEAGEWESYDDEPHAEDFEELPRLALESIAEFDVELGRDVRKMRAVCVDGGDGENDPEPDVIVDHTHKDYDAIRHEHCEAQGERAAEARYETRAGK